MQPVLLNASHAPGTAHHSVPVMPVYGCYHSSMERRSDLPRSGVLAVSLWRSYTAITAALQMSEGLAQLGRVGPIQPGVVTLEPAP